MLGARDLVLDPGQISTSYLGNHLGSQNPRRVWKIFNSMCIHKRQKPAMKTNWYRVLISQTPITSSHRHHHLSTLVQPTSITPLTCSKLFIFLGSNRANGHILHTTHNTTNQ